MVTQDESDVERAMFDNECAELRADVTRTRDDLLAAIALAVGVSPGAEVASFHRARRDAAKLGLYP